MGTLSRSASWCSKGGPRGGRPFCVREPGRDWTLLLPGEGRGQAAPPQELDRAFAGKQIRLRDEANLLPQDDRVPYLGHGDDVG
jgi:hypothetical protein